MVDTELRARGVGLFGIPHASIVRMQDQVAGFESSLH
jgi:hypothetical protein